MASSFTTTQQQQPQQHQLQHQPHQSQHTSNLAGPDIKLIASSFVKQYYTLLNKAPCFIHNFYNHDSTFIHGTIEMGNEHPTEPVVGREQIENKMKELKLNDCRAKIKQIDCLETLASGLVIQVIGELSNNGRPMRRFLQTFVLAPSPDQARHDGDSKAQMRTAANTIATTNTNNTTNDNRRSVQISENNTSSSHNQKFYVLNSIFRYQDDGPDSEFEDDSVSLQANTSIESANGATNEINDDNHNIRAKPVVRAQQLTQQSATPNTAATVAPVPATTKQQPTVPEAGVVESSKRAEPSHTTKAGGPTNGTNLSQTDSRPSDKKIETSEKAALTENGKFSSSDNQSQVVHPPKGDSGTPSSSAASQGTVSAVVAQQSSAPAPRPSNEPKTWANMVRNALPPSSSSSIVQASTVISSKEQQPSPNQAHQTQNNQQNPQHQTPQNEHQQNAQNNNGNNRRRHMIRKPSNKAGAGRTMKNRNPRPQASTPTTATPAAPSGKPTA